MSEPTLVQIFGTGTTRLASGAAAPSSGLFIPDSALISAGLTTPTTATAEGHLVAVVINAESYLTQANFDANVDQSLIITDDFSSFTNRGSTRYRQDQKTISLVRIDSGSTLNPGDY